MNKHIILLFIILCIGLTRASAQHSITGKVLDATNQEPIPFASVTIKNVKSGTTTDNNGNFTLKVNNNDILIVSFMGYETKEVNIGTQKKVTILLSESSVLLDAVVVTGFQNLKKTTFTGSSVKIKADDKAKQPEYLFRMYRVPLVVPPKYVYVVPRLSMEKTNLCG